MQLPDWLLKRVFSVHYSPNCPRRWCVRLLSKGQAQLDGLTQHSRDVRGHGDSLEAAAWEALSASVSNRLTLPEASELTGLHQNVLLRLLQEGKILGFEQPNARGHWLIGSDALLRQLRTGELRQLMDAESQPELQPQPQLAEYADQTLAAARDLCLAAMRCHLQRSTVRQQLQAELQSLCEQVVADYCPDQFDVQLLPHPTNLTALVLRLTRPEAS